MTTSSSRPTPEHFLAAARELAKRLGWPTQLLPNQSESTLVARLHDDPRFDGVVWAFDSETQWVRCLLLSKDVVPAARKPAVLELCARINEGLPAGCAEYNFRDQVVVFRDSVILDTEDTLTALTEVTGRTLQLGAHYADAVLNTVQGAHPEAAITQTEAKADPGP